MTSKIHNRDFVLSRKFLKFPGVKKLIAVLNLLLLLLCPV
uniref:Uncharacterized protein n=1 Tax=Anguilla anguilla TaxID=7936 RepID=A0A0E9QBC9_ANGAN